MRAVRHPAPSSEHPYRVESSNLLPSLSNCDLYPSPAALLSPSHSKELRIHAKLLTICHRDVSVGELLMKTTIGQGGRLVIPSPYRKALGLRDGDDVIVSLKGDELRIQTTRQAIRRAQQFVRRYVPRGRSLVAELIAERRRNARRENPAPPAV